ncbi:helix-turn-helix domain-containing protein [Lentilactobacillus hilgardii]|uniref:helix-turn-helix domain-containing protein n=1 Tax=Lentilactobacillus hilgardii TaxID=1588 RepID=UPI0021A654AD|nr:helix-turn-helix transcriptional regulator [Lentilactobacillus hilgardii]MCT3395555.1 XRE family transcriptional regulator [Lentilactobacillus hilgardii]
MIGSHIRDLRSARQMSQDELGKLVNIDQTLISRVERNHRKVTVDELPKFAKALGVSTEDLLNGEKVSR